MDTFLEDVWLNLQSYYDELVVVAPKFVLAILVFLFFLFLAPYVGRSAKRILDLRMDDKLLINFLGRIIRYVFVSVGFLLALRVVGMQGVLTSLLAGAGISAFIIGFAFKDIGENFLAGLIMAFKRPFRIGDTVETQGITGVIIAMNFRDTQVKTFDGKDVFIPNGSILKNPLYNFTIDGYLRNDFVIGIDYDSDVDQAVEIVLNVLKNTPGVLTNHKKPVVTIDGLGTSTINLKAYFWINTFDKTVSIFALKTRIIQDVIRALVETGFYLPSDVVELKNYQNKGLLTNTQTGN